jgi:hypothetical protein
MHTLRFLLALAYASATEAVRVRWCRYRAAVAERERRDLQAVAETLAAGVRLHEGCPGVGEHVALDVAGYAACRCCHARWFVALGDSYVTPEHAPRWTAMTDAEVPVVAPAWGWGSPGGAA